MAAYVIKINGREYGLISRYSIPKWLEEEYAESEATIYSAEGAVDKYISDVCPLCDRTFDKATKPFKCVSTNLQINRYYGYPPVLCIDCRYYIEYIVESSDSIPQSIRKTIDDGFVPVHLNKYI
jgi:hypothetical protein